MTSGTKTTIYPVKDLAAAKAFYTDFLGAEPYVDLPTYVGFKVGSQEVGLDPTEHEKGLTGPLPYWRVEDIDAVRAALLASGATERSPIREVAAGRSIASLNDPDGNVIGIMQTEW